MQWTFCYPENSLAGHRTSIRKRLPNWLKTAASCGSDYLGGRTRACLFNGEAEYDSIRAVKQKVSIPVIANGDITGPA